MREDFTEKLGEAQREATEAKPENPQAFPLPTTEVFQGHNGMTLQDYFAGQAIVSMGRDMLDGNYLVENIAKYSYELADAMLKERIKRND